eukprot:CAMPEP_0197529832 /NCGR_PEP_ID=MMETSP1318-20131121/29832_1 /TAXON_ID=552666 /ORGANISM="Partenskyella glossopodia, Strain RCC365" /LENGTH=399 /DNA_ID=CAMNT_0043085441 /DNA_START=118 /DNA_END=1317 /DNA_ORIENTATION=+
MADKAKPEDKSATPEGDGKAGAAITATGAAAAAPASEAKEGKKHPSGLSLDERFTIVRSIGQECIQESELRTLLEKHPCPIAYDGFEPSGRMHIAQGILKAINVNKLTKCGVKFVFWVADWFAMLNNKMGGDLKKIKKVGEYMIEVWKAAGMDLENVEFKWAQEEINKKPNEYWMLVMDIARRNSIARVKRCATIMGRDSGDEMPSAQILYPAMQCADIFFLKANICQLGMDQRKVNMLAREYLDHRDIKKKYRFKPIILSHPMLMGLKKNQVKMSKSDPNSAIFMEDEPHQVKKKIKSAYCPPGEIKDNPILDYCKNIIFNRNGKMLIERDEANGGNIEYQAYEDLEADFRDEKLHPGDLKVAVIKALNAMLDPVRKHFSSGYPKQLLKQVRSFKVTR